MYRAFIFLSEPRATQSPGLNKQSNSKPSADNCHWNGYRPGDKDGQNSEDQKDNASDQSDTYFSRPQNTAIGDGCANGITDPDCANTHPTYASHSCACRRNWSLTISSQTGPHLMSGAEDYLR